MALMFDAEFTNRVSQSMAVRAEELALQLTSTLPGSASSQAATDLAERTVEEAAHVAAMAEHIANLHMDDYDEYSASRDELLDHYRQVEVYLTAVIAIVLIEGEPANIAEASARYWETEEQKRQ